MNIVGGLSDQTIFYVWERISGIFSIKDPILASFFPYQFTFRYLINPLSSNQPVLSLFASLITTLVSYNFLLLITFILNLVFSYLFFKRFKNGWIYTLIFCFSAYLMSHFGIHIALSQIWVFPMFFSNLFKWKKEASFRSCLIIGIVTTLTILVSNYYGFFILLFLAVYSFSELLVGNKRSYFLTIFVSVFLSFVFLFPYFKAAFFGGDSIHSVALERNVEDVFYFSSRPWYFVIPPVKNPFIGNLGKSLVTTFQSTGYFLADDYFAAEHVGNYFGLVLILFTVLTSIYVVREESLELKNNIKSLWITILVLVLFMFPPFFTISGLKIYTPGFLICKFFPMFRVTARLSILVLFILLTILGTSFDFLSEKFNDQLKVLRLLSIFILAVTLFETYVPLKIVKIYKSPKVFEYIEKSISRESMFAVYPYGKSQESFFWLPKHKKMILNLRDYQYGAFNSEEFSNELNSTKGLSNAIDLGVNYIVVSKDISEKDKLFFESSFLRLEKVFDAHYLFSVK